MVVRMDLSAVMQTVSGMQVYRDVETSEDDEQLARRTRTGIWDDDEEE